MNRKNIIMLISIVFVAAVIASVYPIIFPKVQSGDENTGEMIAISENSPGSPVISKFANTTCPIMGSKIDPAKVTKELTREYKGQTVTFCCAECPPVWDSLSDTEKDAKLAQAKHGSVGNSMAHGM